MAEGLGTFAHVLEAPMSPHTRRLAATSALALLLAVPGTAASAHDGRSGHHGSGSHGDLVDRIDLPAGWQPEGITTDGRKLYAGSLADGRLLKADPRTGRVKVLPRSATGTPAVGLDHDRRRDVLWVAGGPAGDENQPATAEIRVHSLKSGKVLRTYTIPTSSPRFINDVVVTRKAVYATDSFHGELAVVKLRGKRLPHSGEARLLTIGGHYEHVPDAFNNNGIVEHEDWLLVVQSAAGILWRIDPRTGEASAVDLDGYEVSAGDGLELDDDVLYVVRNVNHLVAALELDDDGEEGELIEEITSDDLDVPTTAAHLRHSLYVVNARFGTDPDGAEYWLTRVDEVD